MWAVKLRRCTQVFSLARHLHHEQLGDDLQQVFREFVKTEERAIVCHSIDGAPKFNFIGLPVEFAQIWETPGVEKQSVGEESAPFMLLSRQCYNPLYRRALNHIAECRWRNPGVVYLGNPGIGKSGFLLYVLWRLLRARENVILKLPHLRFYISCHHNRKDLVIKVTQSAEDAMELMGCKFFGGDVKPFYLADKSIPEVDWGHYRFILACSPKKANYHDFVKRDAIQKLFVPVWTYNELLALNEHQFSFEPNKEVKSRFDKWGGIPRYVLGKVDTATDEQLEAAAGFVNNVQRIVDTQSLPDDATHMVFHLVVNEDSYDSYSVEFASDYVEGKVYDLLPKGKLHEFIFKEHGPRVQSVQGALFESYLLKHQIPRGGNLLFRELQEDGEFGEVHDETFPASPSIVKVKATGKFGVEAVFPDVSKVQDGDVLKPVSGNNGAWDFIRGGSIYQVTVSKTRALPLSGNTMRHFEKALDFLRKLYGHQKQLELCFIVPEYLLQGFSIKWTREERGTILAKIQDLKIVVKVVSFEVSKVCPRCKGMGVLTDVEEAIAEAGLEHLSDKDEGES